jgi:hypothetical protein
MTQHQVLDVLGRIPADSQQHHGQRVPGQAVQQRPTPWRSSVPDHCITPAYASQEARDAAIDTGAGLPVAELLTDVSKSAAAFRTETSTLPEDAWQFAVRVLDHPKFPAEQLLVRRLVEIELHPYGSERRLPAGRLAEHVRDDCISADLT